ncbi:hypothetical protein K443DRAFT_671967 [Laccaria amethystina LaAM-08-1]|uniref:Uncharacterized protein n=1 Tax=Laccaria amethystina LaAM-08-1 TaxID=1095629 RepID=A0A0C9YLK1_9AGAR|nr:hypothetical protein K443DRAFT_671967 [Laccaria amethystina LaAM-08-1]
MHSRPDRPLIVKCTFDKWHKRITFSSARNCSYDLLRHKVEQCFSLYATSYAIAYKDDDGEITNITTETDLTEAIQYFQAGDDAPLSSAASILSGRSFGPRKVTLRVNITVDYDGPSLSDTSSLVSLDDYRNRNGSQQSFSFGAPSVDLDDDSVTVSSKDQGTPSLVNSRASQSSSTFSGPRKGVNGSSHDTFSIGITSVNKMDNSNVSKGDATAHDPFADEGELSASERYPEDPSAVFERLKLQEALGDDSSSVDFESLAANDRGAAWLRDQNERTIRSMLGALPEPSIPDSLSLSLDSQDELGGDLALERDPRGKYYYTYTSGSASQTHGSGDDEGHDPDEDGAAEGIQVVKPRPTSRHLNWLAAQQVDSMENRRPHPSTSIPSFYTHNSDPLPALSHPLANSGIDKEFLPYLSMTAPPPEILTDCSHCGVHLDAIRYVCSTCGEKSPMQESFADPEETVYSYPPRQPLSSGCSSSSQTYVGSLESLASVQRSKPLPSLPSMPSFPSIPSLWGSSRTLPLQTTETHAGYELCSGCIESAGVHHAIEAGLATPGASPGYSPDSALSPAEAQRALQWRRAAPKKGQIRHAYKEKVWSQTGWEDVVLDENKVSKCSTCSAVTPRKRYKCASCPKLHLCRACYSQVHELHPNHAFLIVPDKPMRSHSEPDYLPNIPPDPSEELSLKHPGVKCAHCLLDIVGARFHCAICDSVDICSNCESAGLPGNLDSSDGGHNSSHILIKIPYPLETTELQRASSRAIHLWTGRDAANVGFAVPRSKAKSEVSSYAGTVVGSSRGHISQLSDDHRVNCNACRQPIIGTRYQCAHCPSATASYSLCEACEAQSYLVHDPMHIFFKLPRPVQRPIQAPYALLPPLYQLPAGTRNSNTPEADGPRAYLKSLVHPAALCDRCLDCIHGVWFRCAYCGIDLCDTCEAVDTHDDTHVFMVFKSTIDMQLFKAFANLDSPNGSPPAIPYPVYR